MNFTGLENTEFYLEMSYVTVIAVVLTIIAMEIVKLIMKKSGRLTAATDADVKDHLLSVRGRIIALVIYGVVYFGNQYLLKETVVIDGALLTGLISGGALTLTIAKGLYTSLRQLSKKKNVYARLTEANKKLSEQTAAKRSFIIKR